MPRLKGVRKRYQLPWMSVIDRQRADAQPQPRPCEASDFLHPESTPLVLRKGIEVHQQDGTRVEPRLPNKIVFAYVDDGGTPYTAEVFGVEEWSAEREKEIQDALVSGVLPPAEDVCG